MRAQRHWIFVCWILCCSLTGICLGSCAALGADATVRFREDAPKAWAEFRKFSNASKGNVRVVTTPQAGAAPNSKRFDVLYHWDSNNGNALFEYEYLDGPMKMKGLTSAILANDRYGCKVLRKPSEESFSVKSFTWDPHKSQEEADAFRLRDYALKVDAQAADIIVQDKSFRATRIESKQLEGEERVEVDFECDVKHRPDYNIQSGNFVFAPSKKWAVTSYALRIRYPDGVGFSRGTIEYAANAIGGIPIATRHSLERFRVDGSDMTPVLEFVHDYLDIGQGTATAASCSLSAFGLPEIQAPATSISTTVFTVSIVFGILFILLAVGLRMRRQRSVLGAI